MAKTDDQKKLDLKLFEAVGNGNRRLEKFGTPNLDRVIELVKLGATCDHFLLDGPVDFDSLAYNNCIDYASENFTPGIGLEILRKLGVRPKTADFFSLRCKTTDNIFFSLFF